MMTNAHSQNLSASTFSSQRLGFPLVDRATALELRRSTMSAVCNRRSPVSAMDLTCPPTIRTMNLMSSSPPPSSSVVIVSPAPQSGRGKTLSWSQIKLDLSWVSAAVVALSVTLALAIPLELLGQHG